MPEDRDRGVNRLPTVAAIAMAALILAGTFAWFRPYLTEKRQAVAEIPDPAALFSVSEFTVPPGGRACMSAVGVTPNSRVAEFRLRPATSTLRGGPPVELKLRARGYSSSLRVPGGYPGGSVALPIRPPTHPLIGAACFTNLGRSKVLLEGTTEPRTISRSALDIDGHAVTGDIYLSFSDSQPRSLLNRLSEVFGHASNLTDRLVPVWLIWLLTVLVTIGVPCGATAAFFLALHEDEIT